MGVARVVKILEGLEREKGLCEYKTIYGQEVLCGL